MGSNNPRFKPFDIQWGCSQQLWYWVHPPIEHFGGRDRFIQIGAPRVRFAVEISNRAFSVSAPGMELNCRITANSLAIYK